MSNILTVLKQGSHPKMPQRVLHLARTLHETLSASWLTLAPGEVTLISSQCPHESINEVSATESVIVRLIYAAQIIQEVF